MPGESEVQAPVLLSALRARGLAVECRRAEKDAGPWRLIVSPASLLTLADRQQIAGLREALLDLLYRELPDGEPPGDWTLAHVPPPTPWMEREERAG